MEGGKPKRLSSPVSATSLTKNVAASLSAPKSASASSMAKKAVASLNVPETVSGRSLTKTAAASLNSPKSVSTSSTTKKAASSLNAAKSASASSMSKKAAASSLNEPKAAASSLNAAKSASASSMSKKAAASSLNEPKTGKRKEPTRDDDDAPEEITNETALKNIRLEKKLIRDSVPKNPFRCPDMNANNLTKKDDEDYYNWLVYKKGHLGLTREEEEHLHTGSV